MAETLINEANEAGGRDNITVVLSRLEELDADDPAPDRETTVGLSGARPTGATRAAATTRAVPPGANESRGSMAVAGAAPPLRPKLKKTSPTNRRAAFVTDG